MTFNLAQEAIDHGEIINNYEYAIMVVSSPGLNKREDVVEMSFGGGFVSVMFDSGCYIASYSFKKYFVKIGKAKVNNQLKGIPKRLRISGDGIAKYTVTTGEGIYIYIRAKYYYVPNL